MPWAPSARRPASRWLRILGASALCVALLAAGWTYAVGHWLPEFLRPRIEAAGSQALGAPLRLGRLAIAPWTLEVRADGLQVGPAAAPWLAVAQITTALAPGASLWHFAPVLRRLEVRSPQVTIERLAPGRYNISPLLDALAGERAQGAGAPLRFELRDLSVVDGGLRLIDRVGGRTQRLEALQLRVPELRSPPVQGQEETALVVDARVDGSTVRVEGHSRALLPDRGTTLALRLQQFDLARALADAAAAKAKIDQERAMSRETDAALTGATTRQGYAEIRSTVDGVVTERVVSPGVLASPGVTVLKVAQTTPIRLQANVPEQDLARIRVGSPVLVQARNQKEWTEAKVTSVAPSVGSESRLGMVEAVIPNEEGKFVPGQFISMRMAVGAENMEGALDVDFTQYATNPKAAPGITEFAQKYKAKYGIDHQIESPFFISEVKDGKEVVRARCNVNACESVER